MASYILATRPKRGRKWEGVAIWTPCGEGTTCLAFAEYAFQLAGLTNRQTIFDEGNVSVNFAETFRRQKNYADGAAMRELTYTIAEVDDFADTNRAKLYIANGWSLESQPGALAAAIRHGLITP